MGDIFLGIDYGGNFVKLGLVGVNGVLAGKASLATRDLVSETDCREFAVRVADFVRSMGIEAHDVGGVGLAVPGIVSGEVGETPNVNVHWPLLIEQVRSQFGERPLSVLNDANAAALGELWKGAGSHASSVLMVTLGTGVGSGFAVEGRVVEGSHGAAGELGHVTVVPGGRLCQCGRRGCVEQYASVRGVVATYRELASSAFAGIKEVSGPAHDSDALYVCEAARAGDECALAAFEDMSDKLGFALAQASCMLDPGAILLGGGMSAAADVFLERLRSAYRQYAMSACAETEILCARLGGDAGVFGAARYAMGNRITQ